MAQKGRRAARVTAQGAVAEQRSGCVSVVCPVLAAELLKEDRAGGCLAKPDKASLLLRHSLTNASGPEWARQRKAFEAAASGGMMLQRSRHGHVAAAAAALVVDLVVEAGSRVEARELAQRVAACTVVRMTLGELPEGNQGMESLLIGFRRTQSGQSIPEQERSTADFAKEMMERVTSVAETVPDEKVSNFDPLLHRLVKQKALSTDEAVGNAHSCLLAGFDTLSALVLCALLQLATHTDVQSEVRAELATGESQQKLLAGILQETLRVHPPVSGLPRVVAAEAGLDINGLVAGPISKIPDSVATGGPVRACMAEPGPKGQARAFLPQGCHFMVDLVGLAHGGCGSESSWTWEPRRRLEDGERPGSPTKRGGSEKHGMTGAAPWGIGPRACPAGGISMLLAGEVLKALLRRFDWQLTRPEEDARWFNELSCTPVLTLLRPVHLHFEPLDDTVPPPKIVGFAGLDQS